MNRKPAWRRLSWPDWLGVAVLAAIFALGAFLLFYNLDGRLLWGDEAETAVLARNITRFGLPYTDDGRNVISLYGPSIDNNADGLWTWSPWLQEYIAAASFCLFGPSTWSARIPFAGIGFLSGVYLRHRGGSADRIACANP